MTRPRSKQAHDKVLHAALDLFAERGIEAASMDAIAQASGVSKATIYNHWADKEALLLEVMELIHGLKREPEFVDTGNVCQDLTWVLTRRPPDEYDAQRTRFRLGTATAIRNCTRSARFFENWRTRCSCICGKRRWSFSRISKSLKRLPRAKAQCRSRISEAFTIRSA